jgi:hypothetical protein
MQNYLLKAKQIIEDRFLVNMEDPLVIDQLCGYFQLVEEQNKNSLVNLDFQSKFDKCKQILINSIINN